MATDLERLVVSLEANIKKFEREMARSRNVTDQAMRDVERSVDQGAGRIEGAMAKVGGAVRAGIAGALAGISFAKFTELNDAFTKVQNQLKISGLEGNDLAKTYEQLFAVAQKNGSPIEALATLYGRAAGAQKELNATSQELIQLTNGVAVALRVGGTSSTEASGALLQLGQALASGKVEWEELGSILDGARPILQAAAYGIKEADGSVAKLTELVKEGKISSEALFRGILAGTPALETLAKTTRETSDQGIARLQNALIDLAGKLSEASGASSLAASALDKVAESVRGITEKIPDAMKALETYYNKLKQAPYFQNLIRGIADAEGGNTPREAFPGLKPRNMFDEIAQSDRNASAGSLKGMEDRLKEQADKLGKRFQPKVDPISYKKYPVSGDKGGGGGGKSENEYQREFAAIQKRTGLIETETASVGKSAGAAAEAEAKFRLLEAAKKANVAITPQLQADIDATAAAFGRATEALEKAEEAQRKFEATSRQFGATLSDGFKDAILNGEKLINVFDKLLKSLASRGIDSIFDGLFGKGGVGTGFLKTLGSDGLSFLNPTGRAAGGPVYPGRAYTVGESGRETFVPMTPGRIVPAARSGAGGIDARRTITIDARGAQVGVAEQIVTALKVYDAEQQRTMGQRFDTWRLNN